MSKTNVVLNDEQLKMLKNMGALGYHVQKISNIMKLDFSYLLEQMQDESSDIFKAYQEGKDFSDYIIDLKLFEMAQSGDIKALEKLEKRRSVEVVPKKVVTNETTTW